MLRFRGIRSVRRPLPIITAGALLAGLTGGFPGVVLTSDSGQAATLSPWTDPVAITPAEAVVQPMAAPAVLTDGRVVTLTVENRLDGSLYRDFIVANVTDLKGITSRTAFSGPSDFGTSSFLYPKVVAGPEGTAAAWWSEPGSETGWFTWIAYYDGKNWKSTRLDDLRNRGGLWVYNTPAGIRAEMWAYGDPPADSSRMSDRVLSVLAPSDQGSWTVLAERNFQRQLDNQLPEPVQTVLDGDSPLGLGFTYATSSNVGSIWTVTQHTIRYLGGAWVTGSEVVATEVAVSTDYFTLEGDLSDRLVLTGHFDNGRERYQRHYLAVRGIWSKLEVPTDACQVIQRSRWNLALKDAVALQCMNFDGQQTTLDEFRFSGQPTPTRSTLVLPERRNWTFCQVLFNPKLPADDLCLLDWNTAFVGLMGKRSGSGFTWTKAPTQAISVFSAPADSYSAVLAEHALDAQRRLETPIQFTTYVSPDPAPTLPPRDLKLASRGGKISATWQPPSGVDNVEYEFRVRWGKGAFTKWTITQATTVRLSPPASAKVLIIQVRARNESGVGPAASRQLRFS